MSVSGLGSTPARRPTFRTPPRAVRPVAAVEARNVFDGLTAADRELIFQVTGQRLEPGFDPARESVSRFAASIAGDRAAGRLAPGQEVTAVYLKDLDRRYARAGGPNPIGAHLDSAVGYLARTGVRRIDVTA
jgi:hypothetical protein